MGTENCCIYSETNHGFNYQSVSGLSSQSKLQNHSNQTVLNGNTNVREDEASQSKAQLDNLEQKEKKKLKTAITIQETQQLDKLMSQFEQKLRINYETVPTKDIQREKILQPEILSLIKILKQDKFELRRIEEIIQLVQKLVHLDMDYFHIIPTLLIKKFTIGVFEQKKDILEVEKQLVQVMEKIGAYVEDKQLKHQQNQNLPELYVCFSRNKLPCTKKINLFKKMSNSFMTLMSFKSLHNSILAVNREAEKSRDAFSSLVNKTREKSNGILSDGSSTKIPSEQSEKFKALQRIIQKMFKKDFDQNRKRRVIENFGKALKKSLIIPTEDVHQVLIEIWRQEIMTILTQRNQEKQQIQFTISDLLRAKCLYDSVDNLIEGVRVVESECKNLNYEIIQLDNRLEKQKNRDIVFKIQIENAVCELQLAIKQNDLYTRLDHCVYEILRTPLGVIFGSYFFMLKKIKYPLATNCKDIVESLKRPQNQDDKLIKKCAEYVLQSLQMSINTG